MQERMNGHPIQVLGLSLGRDTLKDLRLDVFTWHETNAAFFIDGLYAAALELFGDLVPSWEWFIQQAVKHCPLQQIRRPELGG